MSPSYYHPMEYTVTDGVHERPPQSIPVHWALGKACSSLSSSITASCEPLTGHSLIGTLQTTDRGRSILNSLTGLKRKELTALCCVCGNIHTVLAENYADSHGSALAVRRGKAISASPNPPPTAHLRKQSCNNVYYRNSFQVPWVLFIQRSTTLFRPMMFY